MSPRYQKPAKCPFGRVLREIMERRGIPTIAELGVRLRMAGYRRCYQSALSQWMTGASQPVSLERFCYYLDKACELTDAEKAAVAAAAGLSEYPLPTSKPNNEESRQFWSSSSLYHHGKLL